MDRDGIHQRDTILLTSGPENDPNRKHLFIVMNNPASVPERKDAVLLIPMSSIKKTPYDKSCVLLENEHSFIKHASFLSYKDAKILTVRELLDSIHHQQAVMKEPVSEALFQKAAAGLYASNHTSSYIKKFYEAST